MKFLYVAEIVVGWPVCIETVVVIGVGFIALRKYIAAFNAACKLLL